MVSKVPEKQGNGAEAKTCLVTTVAEMSGLPSDVAHQELLEILDQSGISSKDLTLDQLRTAMLAYLQRLHLEMGSEAEPSHSGICPDRTH